MSSSCSKIGKLTLARLLMSRDVMISPYATKMAHSEEVLQLYRDLIKVDPPHSRYYKDQSSLVLLQQVNLPFVELVLLQKNDLLH